MKKTINAPVEHEEEETTQYSRESAIKKWLLDDLKKQKYDAAKRAGLSVSKRPGGNPAEGKPSYGISAHESEQDLFAMMDSFLSEKIFSMLEAKINPDNMISPDAKLSGKTPVVASAEGIPPAQYAQAQGVVGNFQTKISESGDDYGKVRFDPHPDHIRYLKNERTQVLPKDSHHAGVAMYGNTKVRNVKFNPETRDYSIGPHKGKTPEEAISTYMENTKGTKTIADSIRKKIKNGPVN